MSPSILPSHDAQNGLDGSTSNRAELPRSDGIAMSTDGNIKDEASSSVRSYLTEFYPGYFSKVSKSWAPSPSKLFCIASPCRPKFLDSWFGHEASFV